MDELARVRHAECKASRPDAKLPPRTVFARFRAEQRLQETDRNRVGNARGLVRCRLLGAFHEDHVEDAQHLAGFGS